MALHAAVFLPVNLLEVLVQQPPVERLPAWIKEDYWRDLLALRRDHGVEDARAGRVLVLVRGVMGDFPLADGGPDLDVEV